MPGVKILRLYGDDMLASPVWRKRWKTARMERSSADHGVYAYSTMAVAMEEYWDAETILAEVVADGKVHAHARGWHADAATITRIYLPMRHWHLRPALLARYGVPIEPLSRLAAPRSTIRGLRPWLATLGVDDVLPLTLPGDDPAIVAPLRKALWRHSSADRLPALYDPEQARSRTQRARDRARLAATAAAEYARALDALRPHLPLRSGYVDRIAIGPRWQRRIVFGAARGVISLTPDGSAVRCRTYRRPARYYDDADLAAQDLAAWGIFNADPGMLSLAEVAECLRFVEARR
jgi:hypothetical protein